MSDTQLASLASEIMKTLNRLPNDVQIIFWSPATTSFDIAVAAKEEKLPMLTSTGGQSELEALLNGFSDWDGMLGIRALRCGQGLYDFWVV